MVHREFIRGTSGLRVVACVAPWLGMLGTAVLLRNALRAQYLPISDFGDCAGGPAEAFVPVALSLPVMIFASAGYHYLRHQVEDLDLEMRIAAFDLLGHLARVR